MIFLSFLTLSRAKSLKESPRFQARKMGAQSLRERAFDAVQNEASKKMTIGGEGVWYKYHLRHPQKWSGLTDPKPPRKRGGSALARTEKSSDQLAFCG
jgi:hypothetical protein